MGEVVTSECQTELLSKEKFELYWPSISQELDTIPHVWEKWFTKESLYVDTLAGLFHVWAAGTPTSIHVVLFTKVLDYPAGRVLQLVLAFGNNIKACIPSITATLEKIANDFECRYCEIYGREGWERLLPGFKRTAVVLTKEIQPFRVN